MKWLLIWWNFNTDNGKESRVFSTLTQAMSFPWCDIDILNWWSLNQIEQISKNLQQYAFALWFANIDNSIPKSITNVKVIHPKLTLITSKRNIVEPGRDENYNFQELVRRQLENKSNLGVEFQRYQSTYNARIFDALWNIYSERNEDMKEVGKLISSRIRQLTTFTRVWSEQIWTSLNPPREHMFIQIVRDFAQKITNFTTVETTRFLWNASFRDTSREDTIFVSKRNTNKKDIWLHNFVGVDLQQRDKVGYYGEQKPSVDTPIQKDLLRYYKNINYILHSHVYIQWAPFTNTPIPCWALEEFEEIRNLYPDRNCENFSVNLKWHGCLLFGNNESFFKHIDFSFRPQPEIVF